MRDLSSLTLNERKALHLLADGHTAKSAAAALGISVHTLNEQLRSARDRTGAVSSRELARALRAEEAAPQKLGAKEFGMAQADATATTPPATSTPPRIAPPKGRFAMGALMLACGAGLTLALSGAAGHAPAASPHVISTYPASGAVAPAGPLILRVEFDRPMQHGSYSFVMFDPAAYPHCAPPIQSPDGRSFSLACTLEPRHAYEVGFNGGRFRNFIGAGDRTPATPAILRFSTR
jgi:DNA-binding CsgD family transcriptional regulator